MTYSIRRIGVTDLEAVTRIMNESSHGHAFEYRLNATQFLFLSNFWDFSFDYSWMGLVDSEPAGVILVCIDAVAREAYGFYWGVVTQFRGRPVSMAIINRAHDELRKVGYRCFHLDCNFSAPLSIYRRFGYRPTMEILQLESGEPRLLDAPSPPVTPIELEEVLLDPSRTQPPVHWTRRPHFLRNAANYLQAVGCRGPNGLEAYAVSTTRSGHTLVMDMQCSSKAAGAAIVRYFVDHQYPRPFIFSYVTASSLAHDLLVESDFHVTKRVSAMTLDLRG